MPIRGLSETQRMPRLGKIRLGIRVANANGQGDHPVKTDHFVCPPDVLEALQREGVRMCGCANPGPIEIPIMLVANDPEAVAPQWYKAYRGKAGLACKGDGYRADALLDASYQPGPAVGEGPFPGLYRNPQNVAAWSGEGPREKRAIVCNGEGFDGAPACPMYAAKKCSRSMSIQFAIPCAPGLGVYQLDTGSVYSILNVNGFLEFLAGVTGGRIAGIPLIMRAEQAEGKQGKVTVIRLDSAGMTIGQLQEAVGRPYIEAQLPPPSEEPDDGEDVIDVSASEVPAVDLDAVRQQIRDYLAWAHANWSPQDWQNLLGGLHGTLRRADLWTERGNLKVSELPGDLAQKVAEILKVRVGPDKDGPPAQTDDNAPPATAGT